MNQSSTQIAAFFDFDDTLVSGDSGKHGFLYQYKNKEIPLKNLLYFASIYYLGKRKWISPYRMIRAFLSYYKGKSVEKFSTEANKFYTEIIKPKLVKNILEILKFHQKENHLVVLVSASPEYLLHPVVKDLNIPHLVSTKLETKEKLYTGLPIGEVCIDQEKVNRLDHLIKELNIDLKNSYAYGNSYSDIPLLNLVGNQIAVNPDPILKKYAMNSGWKIINHER